MRRDQLGDLVDQVTTKAVGRKQADLPYVGLEHVASGTRTLISTAPSSVSVSANGVFESGDVLFGKLRPNLRKAVQMTFGGYCSTDFLVLRPRSGVDPRFAGHAASSDAIFRHAERNSIGTGMPRTSWMAVSQAPIAVPPLEEQRRIAEVLDTIDETIRATERVIAKLMATQTGILRTELEAGALTSRQSTIEREFEIESGITINATRAPRFNPVGYLRVANVQRGFIDTSALAMLEATQGEVIQKGLVAGDLLVVEGHASPREIGRCAVVPPSAEGLVFQNHLFRLRSRSIAPDVAQLLLNAMDAQEYWRRMCSTSSGLHTINSSMLRSMPISVPDRDHQRVLLDLIRASNDSVFSETTQLEKLRRLRSGLASDLLSGRVRTVAV